MRFCGSCGAALDSRTLTSGHCPYCGAAISPTGDALTPAYAPNSMATGATDDVTLPSTPPASRLQQPTAPAQWPQERAARSPGAARRGSTLMLVIGIFLLVCALLLICADLAIVAATP
jgi:hypothetical protein